VALLFRSNPTRDAAELAFQRVVEQARREVFYTDLRVPDTLDGRFELLCLHAFLYLHRLKAERPESARLAQLFFDRMFSDLDRALRDMGTGDTRLGKEMKRMAQAVYGRIRAYDEGLDGGETVLREALARNLFGTMPAVAAPLAAVADYVRRQADLLRRQAAAELLTGRVVFDAPAVVG
jgi:cytochrome b pre-mRNA-processing protein 3